MRKADIADALLEMGIPRKESNALLEKALSIIKETLQKGETVKISGFGNFSVRAKRERQGRNPKTGQPVRITPRKVIRFKASLEFKKSVAPV